MDEFEFQIDQVARQRKIADLLRRKALESEYQGDQGRMVSGHYVAPSWAQNLNQTAMPLMNQRHADAAEATVSGRERGLRGGIERARSEWEANLPQAQEMVPQRQGPVDPNNPEALNAIPAKPLETQHVLKAAMAGARIPGNEKAAETYLRTTLADQAREDAQAFRSSEAEEARAAKATQHAETLASRYEIARLQSDRTLEGTREKAAATKYAADARAAAMRAATEARYAVGMAKAAASAKAKGLKPVPQKVVQELSDLEDSADTMTELEAGYKPEYAGAKGAIDKFTGTWIPGTDSASADWWKEYNNRAALIERHKSFGATLSAGEQKAWKDATISPGMTDNVIKGNLAVRRRLAEKLYNEQVRRQSAASAGNYSVEDVFSPRVPVEPSAPTAPAAAPAAGGWSVRPKGP